MSVLNPVPRLAQDYRVYLDQRQHSPRSRMAAFPDAPLYPGGRQPLLPPYRSQQQGLAQGQPGYSVAHPSESWLPTTHDGHRAVFGTYNNRPVMGPTNWAQYFPNWFTVGRNLPIPALTEPLRDNEKKYCENHGIHFVRKLGAGGFGTVWEVTCKYPLRDTRTQPMTRDYRKYHLACKVLTLRHFQHAYITPEVAVRHMQSEYDIHNSLFHENIVTTEEIFYIHHEWTGFPFIRQLHFMELCDGDLASMITGMTNSRLTEAATKVWFRQICEGLKYLHDLNVVHFDIKVSNILFKKIGQRVVYKLADFGLSKQYKSGAVVEKGMRGTEYYLAPEMRPTSARFDAKPIDIWCLCLSLCESVSGIGKHMNIIHTAGYVGPDGQRSRNYWQISEQFCIVVNLMSNVIPDQRITIGEVLQTQWVRSP